MQYTHDFIIVPVFDFLFFFLRLVIWVWIWELKESLLDTEQMVGILPPFT